MKGMMPSFKMVPPTGVPVVSSSAVLLNALLAPVDRDARASR